LPRRGQVNGIAGRENCTPEQLGLSNALRAVYGPLSHATMQENARSLYCTQSTLSQALGAHRVPDEAFVKRLYSLADAASRAQGEPMPIGLAELLELRNRAEAAHLLARRGLAAAVSVAPVPPQAGDRRDGNTAAGSAAVEEWGGLAAVSEMAAAGRLSELAAFLVHASGAMSAEEVALASAALQAAELSDAADMLLRAAGRRGAEAALAVVDALTRAGRPGDIPAVLAGSGSAPLSRETPAR
jgi:hypothetical protein